MKSRYLYSSLLALSFVISTLAMEEEKEKKGQKTSSLAIVKKLESQRKKLEELLWSFNKKNPDTSMNKIMACLKKLSDLDLEKVKKDLKKVKENDFSLKLKYIMNSKVSRKMSTLSQQLNFPENENLDDIGQNIQDILKKTPNHSIVITKNIKNRNPKYPSFLILTNDVPEKYLIMEDLPGKDPSKIYSTNLECNTQ